MPESAIVTVEPRTATALVDSLNSSLYDLRLLTREARRPASELRLRVTVASLGDTYREVGSSA